MLRAYMGGKLVCLGDWWVGCLQPVSEGGLGI